MLRQEALIWRSLKHPNVLPFYGVDRVSLTYPFLVSPWLRRGSLSNYMKHTSAQLDHASLIGKICDGLEYLHSRDVVHGDIRAGNVLLTNNMEPRLADLGLATLSNATASANPNDTPGSTRWMAPELLRAGQPHSKESDIYAVGCTIIELYTRKPPFSDIPLDLRVMIMVYEGQRPHRPLAGQCIGHPMTDDVWRLVDSCLSSEPRKRPLPAMVRDRLASMQTQPIIY
ncbi:kinase-like protein [Punctularia strigosozonata HHB-11173 SS5]|uniref:Kinase-like protein n=1 Tax=Punctularia strigosozonata (strain HHB-11173) TaxID=741275 RepID=R7S4D1_PUNST|nr:kinase-like protein [Punctularia strigosozonata HHB-11173 SS5]EIN05088.1 kinase-like protein [Punctularia strigosozonata HHB-11173 SS5]